jgi:hypothetical protein
LHDDLKLHWNTNERRVTFQANVIRPTHVSAVCITNPLHPVQTNKTVNAWRILKIFGNLPGGAESALIG